MVRKYALIEKCALIRERFMAPPTFKAYQQSDRNVLPQTHRGQYPPFEDIVSGKETGNRGFEKHRRFRRAESRTGQPQ